jgi:hypothetical protein
LIYQYQISCTNYVPGMRSLQLTNNEIVNALFAAISLCSSLSVVLTGVAFAEMRKRLFMHIIFFISFSDLGTSVGALLGYPGQGTIACSAQAFLVSYFIKTTIFWNAMLCYQLYSLVVRGTVGLSITTMHLIIWPLAALLALLPLTTSTYGRSGPNTTVEWCFLHEHRTPLYVFWNFLDWIAVVLVLNLLMVWLARQVLVKLRTGTGSAASQAMGKQIYQSLFLFPLVLFCTYFPLIFCNVFVYFYNRTVNPSFRFKDGSQLQILCIVSDAALLYGASLSFIFYWKSPEARNRWKRLLCGHGQHKHAIVIDFDENIIITEALRSKSQDNM